MPLPLAVLVVLLFLAALAAYAVLVYRSFRLLRRRVAARGYKSPAALTLAGGVALVLPIGLTFAFTVAAGSEQAIWFALGAFLAVPAALSAGVRLLPAKSPRTPGRRASRFPYARVGQALLSACGVLVITGLLTGLQVPFQVFPALFTGGVACLAVARRLRNPDAAEVLSEDHRAPVVYLRPFSGEEGIFVQVERSRRELLRDLRRNMLRQESERFLTLEWYLKDEVTRVIGPMVALGNPLDFAPPGGAARLYVADDEWMTRFAELAARAACLVAVPGDSAQLVWELARLRTLDLHQRLFVLTRPPYVEQTPAGIRVRRAWTRLWMKPPGMHDAAPIPWSTFAEALRSAGYDPAGTDPGPGALVGFDAEARAQVLGRDLRSATATVEAMATQLRRIRPRPASIPVQ